MSKQTNISVNPKTRQIPPAGKQMFKSRLSLGKQLGKQISHTQSQALQFVTLDTFVPEIFMLFRKGYEGLLYQIIITS